MGGHSGRKSDPSVAVLTPTTKGLTPMAVKVIPVVTVLPPPLVLHAPLCVLCERKMCCISEQYLTAAQAAIQK